MIASGSSTAKNLLIDYQNVVFSKKLLEVLPSIPNKEVKDVYYSKITSKINKDVKDITVSDLLKFRSELETVIMGLKNGTCALACIEEGCIEIDWFIPMDFIDHAYKSACLKRHKFHTLDLQYLQIGSYRKIYDPMSTLHSTQATTLDLVLPKSVGKLNMSIHMHVATCVSSIAANQCMYCLYSCIILVSLVSVYTYKAMWNY